MRTGPCAAIKNGDPGTVAHDSETQLAASSHGSECVTANRSAVLSQPTVNLPTSYATLATSDTTRPSVCSLWYARSTAGANTASAASRNAELTTGNRGA